MISQAVSSANLKHVGHSGSDLYILFNSGIAYRYDGVPVEMYQALLEAESAGSYFHHNIKGKYTYTKLEKSPFVIETIA